VKYYELTDVLSKNTKSKHAYFQALAYTIEGKTDSTQRLAEERYERIKKDRRPLDTSQIEKEKFDSAKMIIPIYNFDDMTKEDRVKTANHMKTQLRNNIKGVESQLNVEENKHRQLRKYEIEFHRKFSLSFSIIILFFVGAPLGAIVKKGGFGAPVVIAALLFMIYFVLITIGDGMANSGIITPFIGMWGPNMILSPVAILLMRRAANDRGIVRLPSIFKKKKKKTQ